MIEKLPGKSLQDFYHLREGMPQWGEKIIDKLHSQLSDIGISHGGLLINPWNILIYMHNTEVQLSGVINQDLWKIEQIGDVAKRRL